MKAQPDITGARRQHTTEPEPLQALAEARLHAAAVRVTPARVKVLGALLGARRAFSHQDMQDAFADMDRVTLYRALDCLTDAGLAHKIAGDDRVFRYSTGIGRNTRGPAAAPARQHQHGHFKCTRCARVFCIDGGAAAGQMPDTARRQTAIRRQLQNALQETLGKGFQSHDIELTIKGWCADCAH